MGNGKVERQRRQSKGYYIIIGCDLCLATCHSNIGARCLTCVTFLGSTLSWKVEKDRESEFRCDGFYLANIMQRSSGSKHIEADGNCAAAWSAQHDARAHTLYALCALRNTICTRTLAIRTIDADCTLIGIFVQCEENGTGPSLAEACADACA